MSTRESVLDEATAMVKHATGNFNQAHHKYVSAKNVIGALKSVMGPDYVMLNRGGTQQWGYELYYDDDKKALLEAFKTIRGNNIRRMETELHNISELSWIPTPTVNTGNGESKENKNEQEKK